MIPSMIKKHGLLAAGVVLGALGGYLYWHFVGCNSGQCMITSVWYNSTGYGALMGGLLASTVKDWRSSKSKA